MAAPRNAMNGGGPSQPPTRSPPAKPRFLRVQIDQEFAPLNVKQTKLKLILPVAPSWTTASDVLHALTKQGLLRQGGAQKQELSLGGYFLSDQCLLTSLRDDDEVRVCSEEAMELQRGLRRLEEMHRMQIEAIQHVEAQRRQTAVEEALVAYQQDQEQNNQALRYDLMVAAQKRMEEVEAAAAAQEEKLNEATEEAALERASGRRMTMALVAPLGVGQIVFFTLLVFVSFLYGGGELALDSTIDPASLVRPGAVAEGVGLLDGAAEPEDSASGALAEVLNGTAPLAFGGFVEPGEL